MACSKDALKTAIEPRGASYCTEPMPSPRRILYVEDNEIVREVTAELLAQERHEDRIRTGDVEKDVTVLDADPNVVCTDNSSCCTN